MINYDYLLFVLEKLGQLSNTINRYTSLPAAAAQPICTKMNHQKNHLYNTYGHIPNSDGEILCGIVSNEIHNLETSVTQLKETDKAFDGKLAQFKKELDGKMAIVNNKLDQVPIISTVVQEHGNTIDSMIDEDKSLREKIRDLSDRLDFHERAIKFICSAYDPVNLNEQAKEMYGLICPKNWHDEL